MKNIIVYRILCECCNDATAFCLVSIFSSNIFYLKLDLRASAHAVNICKIKSFTQTHHLCSLLFSRSVPFEVFQPVTKLCHILLTFLNILMSPLQGTWSQRLDNPSEVHPERKALCLICALGSSNLSSLCRCLECSTADSYSQMIKSVLSFAVLHTKCSLPHVVLVCSQKCAVLCWT